MGMSGQSPRRPGGEEFAVEEIMAQVQAASQGQTDGSFAKNAENVVFRVSMGSPGRPRGVAAPETD